MDTGELEGAYKALLGVARGPFRVPSESTAWSAEQHLAHVVAVDRLLLGVTAGLLAGAERPVYDTTGAGHEGALDLIARAAGDLDGLVATLRQTGRELVLLVRRLEPPTANRAVATHIVDGDVVRVDAPLPWSGVLATHAEVDLPARTAMIGALVRHPSG